MKKILNVILVGFLWAFCSSAGAASFTGGAITLNVPEGWEAIDHSSGKALSEVRLIAPQNTYRASFAFYQSDGRSSEAWAEFFAERFKADPPIQSRIPEMYAVVTPDKAMRLVTTASQNRVLVIIEGKNAHEYDAEIRDIVLSLRSSNPEEQRLFDTVKQVFSSDSE